VNNLHLAAGDGNDLHLGGSTTPTDSPELVVAGRTKAPVASVALPHNPTLVLAGTTRKPVATVALPPAPIPATVAARTRRPTAAVSIGEVASARVTARLRRPTAIAALAYDPNLLSGVVGTTADAWRQGARIEQAARAGQVDAQHLDTEAVSTFREGHHAQTACEPAWAASVLAVGDGKGAWREGDPAHGPTAAAWRDAPHAAGAGYASWRAGAPSRESSEDEWMRGLPRPTHGAQDAWQDGTRIEHPASEGFQDGQWLPKSCDRNSWQDADWVGYVRRVPVPWVRPPRPWVPKGNDLHLCRLDGGNDLHLGYQCERRIPRRRSYHVLHTIEIVRLSDEAPIACSTVTIGLDADSWAWTWSATLLGPEALALVLPSELGEPVTLQATIDGHVWHLVVEDWQEDRQFASRSIKVSGRGLSAWLGQPYEPAASGTLANARTLNQAMEELLPLGGGWMIEWAEGTPDWLLPAGAWNWAGKALIQAIHEAAQAVGLVVVPAMAAKTLTVQPRYPVLPWHYQDATPDLYVPDAAILSVSRRQAVPSQANAVYVHGGAAGGIIARVWRTGTAGDRLATTASAEQITHTDGARLLGERLLAAQEQQPQVRSFTLPLGGVFLLAQLGELVSLEIGGEDVRGIVNGVAIAAQDGTVQQTVTIGEDTPNVWALWRRLLPEAPLLLGEIVAIHADGTRTVDLIGGGRQRVRGDGAVGTNVWVRSGQIEGEAPALPSFDVEIF
jgi:hypothetical protein